MADTRQLLSDLSAEMRAIARLDEIRSLLAWDQQTMLAAGGHAARAEQLAIVSSVHHARFTAPRVGDLLRELSQREDIDELHRRGVALLLRDYHHAVAVPASLVERLALLQGKGHIAWMEARASKDFQRFVPALTEIFEASKERASAIAAAVSPGASLYDVLVDEFEPGMTSSALTDLLSRLRGGLLPLLDAIRGAPAMPVISGLFPVDAQLALCRDLASKVGFDMNRGRVDVSTHPFTTRLGSGDVRLTTQLHESDPLKALGALMHEAGHAMYEQGLPSHLEGSGVEAYPSMGMHESQSRFWENTIGRSLPFFRWLAPQMAERFGAQSPSADALYRAANRVVPGTNRVMSDEVTYNLHIIVRFEIERDLFAGKLAVGDLKEAWNEAYRRDLAPPKDDVDGVLQDVHWSGAAFGYFPTYTLGNLYSAAFGRKMRAEIPSLWEHVERGEFAPILSWLREKVHEKGRRFESRALVDEVTREGDRPTDVVADLLDYLWARHGALHGVSRPAEG